MINLSLFVVTVYLELSVSKREEGDRWGLFYTLVAADASILFGVPRKDKFLASNLNR